MSPPRGITACLRTISPSELEGRVRYQAPRGGCRQEAAPYGRSAFQMP